MSNHVSTEACEHGDVTCLHGGAWADCVHAVCAASKCNPKNRPRAIDSNPKITHETPLLQVLRSSQNVT